MRCLLLVSAAFVLAGSVQAGTLSQGDFEKAVLYAKKQAENLGSFQSSTGKLPYFEGVTSVEPGNVGVKMGTWSGYGGDWTGGEWVEMPVQIANLGSSFSISVSGPLIAPLSKEFLLARVKSEVKALKDFDDVTIEFIDEGGNLNFVATGGYPDDSSERWFEKRLAHVLRQTTFWGSATRKQARMGLEDWAKMAAKEPVKLPLSMAGIHGIFPDWAPFEKSKDPTTPGWWSWGVSGRGYTVGNHGTDIHFRIKVRTSIQNVEELKDWVVKNPGPASVKTKVTTGDDVCYVLSQLDLTDGMLGGDIKKIYDEWYKYSIKAYEKAPK